MARKHLRELLVEDQEPFLLESYISDRRRQLNKPPRPLLVRQKPISFGESFLKNANTCFRYDDPKNSSPLPPPRFDAALRARAKTVGNNTVLLRVPTSTAALLLEAALRIEICDPPDGKKQGKPAAGAGAVESLFRKFARFGRRSRKKEFGGGEGDDGVLVRDILRLDKSGSRQKQGKANTNKKKSGYVGNCPCRTSEPSEASRGGRESFDDSEGSDLRRSPFRYPTPELRSPTVSPTRSTLKDEANREENDPCEIQPEESREVEKEQSSPVSVLDPPLYDDDDNVREHEHAEDQPDNVDDDGYEYADDLDYETSYTRTKQQLLQKLYRFERLAGLDPVELEQRMMEQDDSEDEDEDKDGDGAPVERKMKVTEGMMKLVSGLVIGEQQQLMQTYRGSVTELRIGIDMVIQGYLGRRRRWDQEENHRLEDTATEIEVSILGFLVEELSEDLSS